MGQAGGIAAKSLIGFLAVGGSMTCSLFNEINDIYFFSSCYPRGHYKAAVP